MKPPVTDRLYSTNPDTIRRRKWNKENPEANSGLHKKYRKNNPDKFREYSKKLYQGSARYRDLSHNLKLIKKYGITLQEYNSLLEKQNHRCAICYQKDSRRLGVDHCHITKRIRGLLCTKCNRAVGLLKDDPKICRTASRYLSCNVLSI